MKKFLPIGLIAMFAGTVLLLVQGTSMITEKIKSEEPKVVLAEEASEDSIELVSHKNDTPIQHDEFVENIAEDSMSIAQEYDLYASVLVAQAVLESDWGLKEISQEPYHNLFGTEGVYHGKSKKVDKKEFTKTEGFRTRNVEYKVYPDYKESLKDYAVYLRTLEHSGDKVFEQAWKSNAKDYKKATKALVKHQPIQNYDEALNQIIEQFDLTRFDKEFETKQEEKVMITTDYLNLREDSNTDSKVLEVLPIQTEYTITEQKTGETVNGNNVWYFIEEKGWSSGYYLKEK